MHLFAALFSTMLLLFINEPGLPQGKVEIPDFFIEISDDAGDLQDKIRTAHKRLSRTERREKFWVGYRFEFREDVEFNHIYLHDEGWISFSKDSWVGSVDEDDLETNIWQALGELGDEEAKEHYRNRRREMLSYAIENWGLFYLLEPKTLAVQKVKLFHFRQKRIFDDFPVFWLGDLGNNESFDYLTDIVENDDYSAEVVKPAIFVLSQHNHRKVIPFLKGVAGGRNYFEISKTAAFWLGQIPDERSFDALSELFEQERSRDMKEKLVFSMSQHDSKRKVNSLAQTARDDDEHLEVRKTAIFWLGQIDSGESLDVLEDLLKKSRLRELKEKIVFSVSQHKSRRAPSLLIQVARKDRDLEVRKKAIFWLGQMAGRKTLKALGDIVENEKETELKTKAVFSISQHQDKELAVETLIDIAQNNPDPEVRKKAMFWLGQTGDRRAVDFFKEVLSR